MSCIVENVKGAGKDQDTGRYTPQPARARRTSSAIIFAEECVFLFFAARGIAEVIATSGRGGLFPAPN